MKNGQSQTAFCSCAAVVTRAACLASAALLFPFARPRLSRPDLFSNLKFEISNPLRPLSPLPSALGSVSGKTHHSPLATRISRNPREYRLFGAVLSDSRTGRSNAPATHHSPLTTRPGPISNLKFEISNPLRPFSPLPSAFSLSKCPSLIRKNPSLIPEYPPRPFWSATNSSTTTSITPCQTLQKRLP